MSDVMQARKRKANSEAENSDDDERDEMTHDEEDVSLSLDDDEPSTGAEIEPYQERIVEILEEFQEQVMKEIAEIKTAIQALQTGEKLMDAKTVRQHVLYYVFPHFPKASVIKVSWGKSVALYFSLSMPGGHNIESLPSNTRLHPALDEARRVFARMRCFSLWQIQTRRVDARLQASGANSSDANTFNATSQLHAASLNCS